VGAWVVGAEAAPRCASRAVSAGGRVGRAGGRSEGRSGEGYVPPLRREFARYVLYCLQLRAVLVMRCALSVVAAQSLGSHIWRPDHHVMNQASAV
jgi:hypothetical protein